MNTCIAALVGFNMAFQMQGASDLVKFAGVMLIFGLIFVPMLVIGIKEKRTDRIILGAFFAAIWIALGIIGYFRCFA